MQPAADNPNVERPEPPPPAVVKTTTAAKDSTTITESVDLAGKGLSLEDIAARRGLKPTTVAGHLASWLEEGNQLEIDHLIDKKKRTCWKNSLQFWVLNS